MVDTASSDEGPALARAAGAEVVVLEDNPGFGAANNVGVERAEHPVTVLLNPDCELLDGSLALLAARAAGGELWVPRLLNPDGSLQRSAYPLPGTVGALLPAVVHPPILPEPLLERVEPFRSERARSVGWAIAACVAASTETLRRLGPFDPGQFMFYEDMDLCLRARAAGIPTVFEPAVRIRHVGGHSTRPVYDGDPHDLLAQTEARGGGRQPRLRRAGARRPRPGAHVRHPGRRAARAGPPRRPRACPAQRRVARTGTMTPCRSGSSRLQTVTPSSRWSTRAAICTGPGPIRPSAPTSSTSC